MTKILEASTKKHFKAISALAHRIWREHYIPIIGELQVEYMLENFQSSEAMYAQYLEGYQYFMVYFEKELVGYLSVIKQNNSLFLSKIYVSKDLRGKKIGKTAMAFIEEKALEQQCKSITLGVNKYNTDSIAAYKAMGFKQVGEEITDIGNGFVMDDYSMKKLLL